MSKKLKEHLYFVQGMRCASCEVLIEKELLALKGVRAVEAKTDKGEVLIEYEDKKPSAGELNSIFKKLGYVFFEEKPKKEETKQKQSNPAIFVIPVLLILGFLFLNKMGLSGFVNVSGKSSLFAFLALGLVAGISSCAALVGGMILSLTKQWLAMYSEKHSTTEKLQPHIMFNVGRVVAYFVLGAALGVIGSKLQISLGLSSFLIVAVSVLMALLALQMLGVKKLRKFQFTMPKFITRRIANEKNFNGRYMPAVMGALTFFLPCGFTITAQGMALISGNPLYGGLIMSMFALGTAPSLLLIGFSSIKFSAKPLLAENFTKVAAVVILFFAIFNVNSQLNVLGLASFSDAAKGFVVSFSGDNSAKKEQEGLASIINGKQVLKMQASSSGYSPNYFKVKVGAPVRWEITDVGTSGCTNAVISKSLFEGDIPLTPGKTSVKEFTPTKAGRYKFSCWMGMVSGIIEVVSDSGASAGNSSVVSANSDEVIPSGAAGCGCGGGGGSSCGAR